MKTTQTKLVIMVAILSGVTVAEIDRIELTPSDVGSSYSYKFSTLPTADPALFGLIGTDVRGVNFDTTSSGSPLSSGTYLTTQYADLGIIMNSIRISNNVHGGPASPLNTTLSSSYGSSQIYTFSVPVVAVGVINTSPDYDAIEFWSGPNGTGTMLDTFIDQEGLNKNYNIDRFVGGRATGGDLIGSLVLRNAAGGMEMDELIFETVPEPATMSLLGLGGMVLLKRRK